MSPLHQPAAPSESALSSSVEAVDPVTISMTRRQWLARVMLGGAAATFVGAGCSKWSKYIPIPRRGSIKLLAPPGYFSPELLDRFLEQTGYEVIFEPIPPDDELVGLFEAGLLKCDLMMPSAFVAKTFADRNQLKPFDHSLLVHGSGPPAISSFFNPIFDPHNKYVIPYIWGSTGIGYDSGRVDGLPASWGTLLSGEAPPMGPREPNGFGPISKIVFLDDARFTIGVALLYLHYSPNTLNPKQIEEAADLLVRLNRQSGKPTPLGNSYYQVEYKIREIPDLLRSGEVGLSMAWSGDIVLAMNASQRQRSNNDDRSQSVSGNSRLRLALPVEGSILFRDSFMMPSNASAENSAGVHKFIEFLLQPKNAAEVSEYSYYATTVVEANAYINRFTANGPSFFFHPSGKDYFLEDVGEATHYYDEAWKRIKASAGGTLVEAPPVESAGKSIKTSARIRR